MNKVLAILFCLLLVGVPLAQAGVNLSLQKSTIPAEADGDFNVELYLDSSQDQGITGVQAVLSWDPSLLQITGATTHVPFFWGGFQGVYGGVNTDLTDGDAVYVYLVDFPPAVPPRSNVHLATIHCHAVNAGVGSLDIVHQVPASTLWTRVANDQAQDVTGDFAGCQVEVVDLLGDVNGDGQVDNSDLILVRVNRGKEVTDANRSCDVNRDGNINNSDMILVRTRRG